MTKHGYDNKIDTRIDVLEFLEQRLRAKPHSTTSDLEVCEKFARDENDVTWIVSEMKLMAEPSEGLLEKGDVTTGAGAFYNITSKGVEALKTTYNFEYQNAKYRRETEKRFSELEKEKTETDRFNKNYTLQKYGVIGSIIASAIAIIISVIAFAD